MALYVLCFAGGVTLIVIFFFAAKKLAEITFQHFALLFISATVIMIVEALKNYEGALAADFGPGFHVAKAVLSFAANGVMGWILPLLAFEMVNRELSRERSIVHALLAAALAVLGALKEFVAPFLLWNFDYVALFGLHGYGAFILIAGYGRIRNPWVRSITRSYLIFLAVFAPLAAAQLVIQNLPSSPAFLHDYPLEELFYYLGFVIMVLVYVARYFLEPAADPPCALPDDFMQRYGISKREGDIICKMIQGDNNGAIAEKLFISALTVKNHVYHIYRKTGAGNKVHLINLINSMK